MNLHEIAATAGEIYVLPDAVARLKTCMDDEAASIDDVAEIITFDPALTAQILKVANSALYRFPNRIETISKAIQVIGTRAAYDLALAYGISHAFSDVESRIIDLDRFWEQSVSCALLAKYLAETKKIKEPERLFVSGLLHNIGELVMTSLAPELAQRCQSFNARVSPADLQRAVLGFSYAQLSAELVKRWAIPDSIYLPVQHLHDDATAHLPDEYRLLQLSYILALDNVYPEIYPGYSNLLPHMHEPFNLNRNDLEDALDITNLQCISVIALFNPGSFVLY